jgi:hypothetical protein
MRFLTTYASDLSSNPQVNVLTTSLVDLIAFALATGDTFLPDPASYDDLFYKIVETGPIITKFRDVYRLTPADSILPSGGKETVLPTTATTGNNIAAIDTLISVSRHFHSLLFQPDQMAEKTITTTTTMTTTNGSDTTSPSPAVSPLPARRKKNLGPREVHQIIKQGYDTLSIQTREDLNTWEKWREADWKLELKRVARCAVEDARRLVV